MMQVLQTNAFKKAYKKLHKNQLAIVNEALEAIVKSPDIGEKKVGDLSWLRVYKFKLHAQLVLIGYTFEDREIVLTFVAMGSHENFYRDIKRQ